MKAAIAGAGQMGVAIAYAMDKLGFDVVMMEPNTEKTKSLSFPSVLVIGEIKEADVIISAATYSANLAIAGYAIEKNIPYCDLGGNPATSAGVRKKAKKSPVFPDLGLAPGLVGIIAEDMTKGYSPNSVTMRVGGLPVKPTGKLNYARSWSVAGLINEYSGTCEILRDGEVVSVPALSEVDNVCFTGIGILESFHTKGGIGNSLEPMKKRGVKSCKYKTIRFKGHASLIDFLMNECKLDNDVLEDALLSACPLTKQDQVLIMVDVGQHQKTFRILHDDNFTAMQKATAFPTAAVAALMATGELGGKPVLDYSDIPVFRMQQNLNQIGGLPEFFNKS